MLPACMIVSVVLLLAGLGCAQPLLGGVDQGPAYALTSPYLQAALDPTVPSWTLTFIGYSQGQWFAEMDVLWLEERQPDGTAVVRLAFPFDSAVSQFNSTVPSGLVSNLAVLSVFPNNASVTTLGQYFANATTISYPPDSISLVSQSFKMSFNISDWPFQASANTLALGFSVRTSVSIFEMGANQFPNGQLRSAEIQGMFDWVRLDLFDFAITTNASGGLAYPGVAISVQKSSAFPPSATAEIVFPSFQTWIEFDPTIQFVVASPDRPQLLLLIVGIMVALLVCLAFGALLAYGCRYYRTVTADMDPRSERTRLING